MLNGRSLWADFRQEVAEIFLEAAVRVAPTGHPDAAILARHLCAWAVDPAHQEGRGPATGRRIDKADIAAIRRQALEAAAAEADKLAAFAAAGGEHEQGCRTVNGALAFGRHQYAVECAAAIRGLMEADRPSSSRESGL